MKKKLISLIAGLACAVSAYAVPAAPGLRTITQPDGTKVTVKLAGDEFLHFTTTADGYTVERNADGYFVYVQKVDGEISRTSVVAHDAANRSAQELQLIESLPKNIVADKAVADANASRSEARTGIKGKSVSATPKGAQYDYSNFRGLVILVEFTDRKFSRTNANEIFSDLVSKKDFKGVPKVDNPEEVEPYTGSVRDYFYDNSMGKFDPEFDVVGPFEIDYTSTSMMDNGNLSNTTMAAVISAIVSAANDTVDFSQYDRDGDGYVDMFYIIFAGFGSNYYGNNAGYIWPHQGYQYKRVDGVYTQKYACSTEFYGYESTGDYGIDGIGTIAHEFSHVLGLVDEYDTDYSGSGGQSFDPNVWSVMSGGSYYNNGRTPVAYSALQRTQAGFSLPTVIDKEGDYNLNITAETNEYYRINSSVDKEYFLLENRNRKSKWDEFLPGDGMLIFHVDSTTTTPWRNNTVNCNPAHNYYQLLRAKPANGYSTDGDPFPGSGNVTRINNVTSPNLVSWSGEKTEFVLSNISIDGDGIVSFSVSKDYFGYVTEDFEAMPTEGDFSNVPGTYTTWSFTNCAPGVYGSTRGNGAQSVKIAAQGGEIIINNVNAQLIEGIEMALWNTMLKTQTINVSVSTDDGATWTEIFQDGKDGAVSEVTKGTKGSRYYFKANVPDKAMFKIEVSGTLYIDDISICYVDPNGLSDVEDIKIADKAQLNVVPATDGIIVGSDSNEAVEVFNAEGQLVARGTANATIALPARGFYIVRQGSATRKFIF